MTTTRFTMHADGTIASRVVTSGLGPAAGTDPAARNCGPTSIAAIIGVPVGEMMDLYRDVCGYGPRWTGGSYFHDFEKILKALGIKFGEQPHKASGTLGKWFERHGAPGRTYIVRTGGHFMAVRDGWLVDQSGSKPVTHRGYARKRVTHVLEVFI